MVYEFCTLLAILAEQRENPAVLRCFLRVRYYPTELADTQCVDAAGINQNFD